MIAEPASPITCASTLPPTIDVVALSSGLPDGVYYAGKQLRPWLSFDDRIKANQIQAFGREPLQRISHEAAQRLVEYRCSETIVVRWEIEGGRAGTPEPMVCGGVEWKNERGVRCFIWGREPGHRDTSALASALLKDAADERWTEKCHDDLMDLVYAFGPEWVLARRDVTRLAGKRLLRKAVKAYHRALDQAREDGLTEDEIRAITEGLQ